MSAHRNAHAVEIDRPAATVFPYLVGCDGRRRWMGVLVECEQMTDGAPGRGTRFRDVFEDRGQRIVIDAEVVEYEPNERFATRLRSKAFRATTSQRLEERDGRTRVTTVIETEYTNRMVRLMAGVITRHAQRQLETDLARLKEIVEAENTPAAA
jgi:uncharacterized protein YndB with AHSA1/START domain